MLFLKGRCFSYIKEQEASNWLEGNILPSLPHLDLHKGQAGSSRHGTISNPVRWAWPSIGSSTVLLSPRYSKKQLDTGLSCSVHPKSSVCLCSSYPDFCAGDIAQKRLKLPTSFLLL